MRFLVTALAAIVAIGGGPGQILPNAVALALQGEPETPAAQAESELDRLQRQTAEAKEREKVAIAARDRAPGAMEDLRQEPPAPVSEPDRKALPTPSLAELEASVNRAQGLLKAAKETATSLEGKSKSRSDRLMKIPGEIERLGVSIEGLKEELNGLPTAPENEESRALLESKVARSTADIGALEAEAAMYEAESELIQLRQDRAQARVSAASRAADLWTAWFNERRQASGDDAASAAEERLNSIVTRFPVLEPFAQPEREHLAMLVGKEGLISEIAAAREEVARLESQHAEIKTRMAAARTRLGLGGLTEGMGATLQRDFKWLPTPRALKAASRARNHRLSEVELQKLDLEDRRDALGDLEASADELLASLDLPEPAPESLREEAINLLGERRKVSTTVRNELSELHGEYIRQKVYAAGLSASAAEYRGIIEEHILWVRGMKALTFSEVVGLPKDVVSLASDHSLEAAGNRWVTAVTRSPLRTALVAALLIGLIAMRRTLKARREELGRLVRSYRTDKFWYTARALVQTALLSAPWPLVLGGTAWILSVPPGADGSPPDPALAALYVALAEVAVTWFVLRFVRGVASEKGIGVQHFRWSSASMALLRREIRWYLPIAVTFGFVTLYLDQLREPEWTNSIGRVAFVVWMVALFIFLRRLVHPASDLWSGTATEDRGLLWRSRGAWGVVLPMVPLGLVGLILAGYDYTALQFENRLRLSLATALALIFGHGLLLRWLFITRRRLAVSQALEAKARRERKAKKKDDTAESGGPAVDVDKVDIPAVDAQTRQLFKSALTLASFAAFYFIWASTLPALRAFDRVQLYPVMTILENEPDRGQDIAGLEAAALEASFTGSSSTGSSSTGSSSTGSSSTGTSSSGTSSAMPLPGMVPATGETANASSDQAAPANGIPASLTLADLLMAIIFGILTLVAARNLPALLELTVLQRLPMDGGARYAISTITRYVILLLGVSAVSGALGVGWQQIQFLAAALTFGLAFGLQEIFANFVSGLIILIERPVRVGDIVTVGGVEGRVTQLRMRATTILDWDRKESLIPNKQFITGNIVNWTLSDSVTRTVIPVGVAYGSDTASVRKILLQVAHESDLVLKDPEPTAIFLRFGDSTLDFQLRVFIENRDIWPEMINQLHTDIDKAFREAGIEIAFPQRDIHIRSNVEPRPEPRAEPRTD